MRSIRHLRQGLIAATLLCIWSGVASGKDVNALLPLAKVRLADNGDLVGWQIDGWGTTTWELVNPGDGLLTLQLFVADQDVSDQISWRRLAPRPGFFGEFVGTHTELALEIHRSYRSGVNPGTIVHELRVKPKKRASRDIFRLLLRVPPSLRKHSPLDRSLGHFFYGYIRFFATAPVGGAFEPVREQRQAAAAAVAARHVAVIITPDPVGDAVLTVHPEFGVTLEIDRYPSLNRQELGAVELKGVVLGHGRYRSFLYPDMWGPLRALARLIERALQALTGTLGNPGIAIILFAILLRAVTLPLNLWSIRQQRQFTAIQQKMKPKIERINKTMKGAAKSEEILKTYKEYKISPFSGLKGSISLFVQLPILIALFAVTTESALFRGAPFLWAPDLSLPDRAVALTFSIPGLGAYVNLLPILLGIISVFAAQIQARSAGSSTGKLPRAGLLLALVFVFFFYSCAAALVLYWMVINVSQIFEGLYVARLTPNPAQS